VVEGAAGPYLFYRELPPGVVERLAAARIPLPAGGVGYGDAEVAEEYARLLEERGIHPGRFNLRKLRQAFFKPSPRDVVVFPRELLVGEEAPDELNPGKARLTVTFFLPRGSYGTMLVKRLCL
jgi:tRNA pseudouridine13 synthase